MIDLQKFFKDNPDPSLFVCMMFTGVMLSIVIGFVYLMIVLPGKWILFGFGLAVGYCWYWFYKNGYMFIKPKSYTDKEQE